MQVDPSKLSATPSKSPIHAQDWTGRTVSDVALFSPMFSLLAVFLKFD